MSLHDFTLEHDAHGHLVHIDAAGTRHESVVPVRAFPLAAPDEGVSLVSSDGHELAWIARLSTLPPALRTVLEQALARREFAPVIQRINSVSTFSTPSTWALETDRGATTLVLKGEEDIRRLGGNALLISSAHGLQFLVHDMHALDRHSRRLLERFL